MKFIVTVCMFLFLTACSQEKNRSYSSKQPISSKKEIGPFYKSYYSPDSVELESIKMDEPIDPITAIKIIANSHRVIKADYLNYLMDFYNTTTPNESKREPMFDAEHFGKFIVWKYAEGDMRGLHRVFVVIGKVYLNGDEITKKQLVRYSILQTIILESREYDINYNTAYNPLLGKLAKEYFDLLDEMETGRS